MKSKATIYFVLSVLGFIFGYWYLFQGQKILSGNVCAAGQVPSEKNNCLLSNQIERKKFVQDSTLELGKQKCQNGEIIIKNVPYSSKGGPDFFNNKYWDGKEITCLKNGLENNVLDYENTQSIEKAAFEKFPINSEENKLATARSNYQEKIDHLRSIVGLIIIVLFIVSICGIFLIPIIYGSKYFDKKLFKNPN